jgi:hypothetical protein
MEGHPILMDQQNHIVKNGYTTKNNLYVQCNPYQNSNDILPKSRKVNPKVNVETQKISNSQSNPEPKEQHWEASQYLTSNYMTEP